VFKTINNWTKQGMIDQINKEWRGKSMDSYMCRYRSKNGAKCAIGMFIPDKDYNSEIEGYGPKDLIKDFSYLTDKIPLETEGLTKLQIVHDGTTSEDDDQILVEILEWVNVNVTDSQGE
jgi:hypothetical protein